MRLRVCHGSTCLLAPLPQNVQHQPERQDFVRFAATVDLVPANVCAANLALSRCAGRHFSAEDRVQGESRWSCIVAVPFCFVTSTHYYLSQLSQRTALPVFNPLLCGMPVVMDDPQFTALFCGVWNDSLKVSFWRETLSPSI